MLFLGFLTLVLFLLSTMGSMRPVTSSVQAHSSTCNACGYDLAGLPRAADHVRCPECGADAGTRQEIAYKPSPLRPSHLILPATCAGIIVLMAPLADFYGFNTDVLEIRALGYPWKVAFKAAGHRGLSEEEIALLLPLCLYLGLAPSLYRTGPKDGNRRFGIGIAVVVIATPLLHV